jgi:DNA-binding MarR family transcriptional regulator
MSTHGARVERGGRVPVAGSPGAGDRRTTSRPELLDGGSDARLRALVYGILGVTVRFDRLRERVGELIGLSGLQFHILMVLAESGDGGTAAVGEVARTLHVSGAYVTMESGKLARAGLVAKRTNPADRREVRLALTVEGREAIAALAPDLREINDVLFGFLTRAQFAVFGAIVGEMLDSTERAVRVAERRRDERRDGERAARRGNGNKQR